jgi:hypothetical protein
MRPSSHRCQAYLADIIRDRVRTGRGPLPRARSEITGSELRRAWKPRRARQPLGRDRPRLPRKERSSVALIGHLRSLRASVDDGVRAEPAMCLVMRPRNNVPRRCAKVAPDVRLTESANCKASGMVEREATEPGDARARSNQAAALTSGSRPSHQSILGKTTAESAGDYEAPSASLHNVLAMIQLFRSAVESELDPEQNPGPQRSASRVRSKGRAILPERRAGGPSRVCCRHRRLRLVCSRSSRAAEAVTDRRSNQDWSQIHDRGAAECIIPR